LEIENQREQTGARRPRAAEHGSRLSYDSMRRAPAPLEELVEAWRYRDLLAQLIDRDIKLRYRRSVLGIAWTLLNPLMMMLVLTFVFSQVFRFAIPQYPTYLLAGTVVWIFFTQSTTSSMAQLIWAAPLMSKIYVPRTIFALSAVGTGLVNLAVSVVPLLLIAALLGQPPTLALLWLVPAVLLTATFALGLGLLLSSLSISFRDVIEMYQILLGAWYFLTPIMYPRSIIPPDYAWIVAVNPMTYLTEMFRDPVYLGRAPDFGAVLFVAATSLAVLTSGWIAFSWRARQLAHQL
jgi:ABC-2 type transport system permease protein